MHKKQKGNGEWCDTKSEKVANAYKEIIKQNHVLEPYENEDADGADQLSNVPFDPKAWIKATGVPKQNKVYGFGLTQEAEVIRTQLNSPTSAKRARVYPSTPVDMEARIESEVNARVESRLEAFKAEMMRQMQEQVKQMMNSQQTSSTISDTFGLGEDNP